MKFTMLESGVLAMPRADIDTDQIIPARFLKTVDRKGLGEAAFHDWRMLPDGSPNPACPLNAPGAAGAAVVIAGANFGCGSSREHAVWALLALGVRVVIAPSYGDIFRNNALRNGLLAIELPGDDCAQLAAAKGALRVDLKLCEVARGEHRVRFTMDAFARHCLLEGVDALGYLLARSPAIAAFEAGRKS